MVGMVMLTRPAMPRAMRMSRLDRRAMTVLVPSQSGVQVDDVRHDGRPDGAGREEEAVLPGQARHEPARRAVERAGAQGLVGEPG